MAFTVFLGSTAYSIPEAGEVGWSDSLVSYLRALATAFPQIRGGTYPLTGELDFGTTFGIKAPYFKSATANPASTGVLRLAAPDSIGWRNNANAADLALAIDNLDNLTWSGSIIGGHGVSFTGASTGPGIVATGGSSSGDGVDGVGTGSGTGGKFQAASLTAPVRGSINLPPVSADPTAPIDGDVWLSATNPFAHIGGAKKTLAALETAQTWTAAQTFAGITASSLSASGDVSTSGNVAAANVNATSTVTAGTVNATTYQQNGGPITLIAAVYGSLYVVAAPGAAEYSQQVTQNAFTDLDGTSTNLATQGPRTTASLDYMLMSTFASGDFPATNGSGAQYIKVFQAGDYKIFAAGSLSAKVGGAATVGFRILAGARGALADIGVTTMSRSSGDFDFRAMSAERFVTLNAGDLIMYQLYTDAPTAAGNVGFNSLHLTVQRVG